MGGTGAYTYSIDAGVTYQPTGSFTSLASGSYTIKVKDADLKATFNGNDLGNVKLINTIKLEANAETVQKVVCQVSGKKILSLIPMAFLTGRSKLSLTGDLKAKVFLFTKKFPVDISENIDLSQIKTGF